MLFLSSLDCIYFFSYLNLLDKTFSSRLKKSDMSRYLCNFSEPQGKYSVFHHRNYVKFLSRKFYSNFVYYNECKIFPKAFSASVEIIICYCSILYLTVTLWTVACQSPLSSTVSQSLLEFMFIESLIQSNHLIFYQPLLFLPSIFPSIRIFSNE